MVFISRLLLVKEDTFFIFIYYSVRLFTRVKNKEFNLQGRLDYYLEAKSLSGGTASLGCLAYKNKALVYIGPCILAYNQLTSICCFSRL